MTYKLVVAVADPFGARRIGANVGAALLFRHRHAHGRGLFVRRRNEVGIIGVCRDARDPFIRRRRLVPERRNRRISHRHGTADPAVGLPHEIHERRVQNVAGLFCRPCGAGDAGFKAERHQVMIGGVEFDLVEPAAIAIKALELGRIGVRLARPLGGFASAATGAEGAQMFGVGVAVMGVKRVPERRVCCEKVNVFEGWRLVRDVVGLKVGAGPVMGVRHYAISGSSYSSYSNLTCSVRVMCSPGATILSALRHVQGKRSNGGISDRPVRSGRHRGGPDA